MNYQKIYQNLVQRSKTRILEVSIYTETHHIIPRCMGGSNLAENLVELTPEEHLIAHLLLVKIYPNNPKLVYAANWMTSRVRSNKEYGWVKREFAKIDSQIKTGVPRTVESIEKQRATVLEKYKNGYTSPILGRSLSDDHKRLISEGNKGKLVPVISRSSLEGYILRYGDIEGQTRYFQDSQKKKTNSLEFYIKKYGEAIGTEKYQYRNDQLSKKMSGESNHFYGKTHKEDTRKKISESNIGKSKVRSDEHNQKIGLAHKGKKHEIVKCPHCGREGGKSTMKQWHFSKCRFK
jgi:hypothetical protein